MAIDPKHFLGYFGSILSLPMHFDGVGSGFDGETHDHDHLTVFLTGSVRAVVTDPDGNAVTTVIVAPDRLHVKANWKHSFRLLTDSASWLCIRATRDEDGELANSDDVFTKPLNPPKFVVLPNGDVVSTPDAAGLNP